MTRAEISTLFQAEAVAMRAKCGQVVEAELRDLAARVDGVDRWVPIGQVVARMIEDRRDRAALGACGDRLRDCVAEALRPQPVDLHRVDIHG